MKKFPKMSLILTSYNCRENIIRTLESIEQQDYPNIEIVIVDGMSTDGTCDIIKEYASKTKHICKWISEKDNGIYDAMNKGYKLATGEVIAFFNDLFLMKNAVSSMVYAIYKNNVDGAHADLIYASDNEVKRIWKMGNGNIRLGWMPGHPTLYLKRDVYEKYGLYKPEYKCSADYEFMVRILKDGNVKLVYVNKVIIRMFYGGTSTANASSYWLSIKEAHRALVENKIQFGWLIVFLRTIKVFIQFVKAGKYKGDFNKCSQ